MTIAARLDELAAVELLGGQSQGERLAMAARACKIPFQNDGVCLLKMKVSGARFRNELA
jgi:hypothetical protein